MNRRLQPTRERDYQNGFADAGRDAGRCETWADVHWYQGVIYGNFWDDRPHYVAGYLDGFKAVAK